VPTAAVSLLGFLRLENIVENAHFLLHQPLDVLRSDIHVDIGSFVVDLSPHIANFHRLGRVGPHATTRDAGKVVSTYRVWDRKNAMLANTALCYSSHSPKFGPTGSMLIARLCIYKVC